jgi:hypothetical protein
MNWTEVWSRKQVEDWIRRGLTLQGIQDETGIGRLHVEILLQCYWPASEGSIGRVRKVLGVVRPNGRKQ